MFYKTIVLVDYNTQEVPRVLDYLTDSYDVLLVSFRRLPDIPTPIRNVLAIVILCIKPDEETLLSWSKAILSFPSILYARSGVRNTTPRYYCRIKASNSDKSYTVQGT